MGRGREVEGGVAGLLGFWLFVWDEDELLNNTERADRCKLILGELRTSESVVVY